MQHLLPATATLIVLGVLIATLGYLDRHQWSPMSKVNAAVSMVVLVFVAAFTWRIEPADQVPMDHGTCEYPVDEITALNLRIQQLEAGQL